MLRTSQANPAALLFALFLAFCVLLSSCTTTYGGARKEGLNRSLASLQKSVDRSLPVGRRQVSHSGREFLSNYFYVENKKYILSDTRTPRYYAHIYILGERRPYTVEVVVYQQKKVRVPGTRQVVFKNTVIHKRLSSRILMDIQRHLTESREDRNIIDDFRVF